MARVLCTFICNLHPEFGSVPIRNLGTRKSWLVDDAMSESTLPPLLRSGPQSEARPPKPNAEHSSAAGLPYENSIVLEG